MSSPATSSGALLRAWRLWLPLLALTLLIGGIGTLAYRHLSADIRAATQRTLTVIAEQKRQEIEHWLGEARRDAELYFSGTSQVKQVFGQWLAGGRRDQALLDRIRGRLADLEQARNWGGVALIDAAGQPVLASGAASPEVHAADVRELLRHPATIVTELHRNLEGRIVYCVLVPIGAPGAPPLGVALLTWLADQSLFPLVGSWPVPTRTAETYLVERAGDQVRFLSPLRFVADAALDKTLPLSTPDLPAALAVQGHQGLIEDGRDYRRVPVLAYTTPIANTPWSMVAEIDQDEAYTGLRDTTWEIGLIIGLGLMVVYTAGFLVWNRGRQRQELAELKAREAADARFRLLFEQHLSVMLQIDPATGRILDANQAAVDFYGYSRDALRAMSIQQINCLAPDTVTAEWQQAAHRAKSDFIFPHRLADGRIRTVEVHATPIIIDDQPVLFSIIHDITERRAIEERLRLSEERHRLLADHSLDVIWTMDLAGRFTYQSPSVETLLGYTPAEAMQLSLVETVSPESLPGILATFEEAIADIQAGRPIQPFRSEMAERHKDGSTVWVETMAAAIYDHDGRFIEFFGVDRDITARKRMEDQLRVSEERYRLIAENATDVIWTMALDGHLTYVSPSVERLRGFTPAEVMQQTLAELVTPESLPIALDGLNKTIEAVKAGRPTEYFRGELQQPCKDGSTIWTEMTATGIYDAQGRFRELLGMTRDISERKRYEQWLQQAREAAEAANAAKSAFLAHMSHEIRTPLNAVLGLAQVLEKGDLTPDQRDMIAQIGTAGRSLLGIINDILDLSKIEAGQIQLEARPFALAPLLTQILGLFEPMARDKGLRLSIAGPPSATGMLLGDPLRLEQVLINLIGNAIKFTNQGEIRVRIESHEEAAACVTLRFAITDTGIGIAPATLTSLFTPFTQADAGITRRFGGTGLGLSISKRLVELMGGAIGAESQPGVGSTFWFELSFPLAADECLPLPAHAATTATGPRLAGRHLLVVDDSAMNLEVVARMLALEGVQTTTATDGRQALDLLRARPRGFDAVLMDVQMPVMDGLTATRAIRGTLGLGTLPVIALTAGVLPEQQAAALAAGVDAILAKPLDLERMVALLLDRFGPAVDTPVAAVARPGPRTAATPPADLPALPGIDRHHTARTDGLAIGEIGPALPLDQEQLTDLRIALSHQKASARRLFKALEPTLAGVLGATDIQTLGHAIRNLQYDRALVLLDQIRGPCTPQPPSGG